jgi:hypothetical protein
MQRREPVASGAVCGVAVCMGWSYRQGAYIGLVSSERVGLKDKVVLQEQPIANH